MQRSFPQILCRFIRRWISELQDHAGRDGRIKHYLVDELDPKEEFHVARFQQMAKDALKEIYAKGKIPLIVGGTGFYIQSLLYDIDFTKEDGDQEYRKQLEEKAKNRRKRTVYTRC